MTLESLNAALNDVPNESVRALVVMGIPRATAERIDLCVNAHDELVAALESLLSCSQHARANGYRGEFMLRESEARARDVLAKVAK